MIFFFSGTGNSRHAALMLQEHFGSETVNMAYAVRNREFTYPVSPGERVFLVFPVYFGGLPGLVEQFIGKLNLPPAAKAEPDAAETDQPEQPSAGQSTSGAGHKAGTAAETDAPEGPEIIGVATNGGMPAGCGRALRKALKHRGMELRAFYSVKAPDNCIFYLNPPIREAALVQLKYMQDRMKDVIASVDYHHRMPDSLSLSSGFETGVMHRFYKGSCKTAKFFSTDACNSCGLCARVCPVQAIEMRDGRPAWVKQTCEHCAACINRCPKDAIQYGRGTANRNRYVHPDLGKKYRVETQK